MIPSDARFWVLACDTDSGYRHLTTPANTSDPITTLSRPRFDGNPDARPIVTRERSSAGVPVSFPFAT